MMARTLSTVYARHLKRPLSSIRSFSAADPVKDKNDSDKSPTEKPSIVPGLVLSTGVALGGFQAASLLSTTLAIPVSGIPTSILLGMAVNNTVGYSKACQPGITFATKAVLQTGIVCVAAKLSILDLMSTGTQCLPVVLSSVTAGLVFLPMAGRLAKLPTRMTYLMTAGTSICGVTAITALAPAIEAKPKDIAVAVANTVAFGTMGMLLYPYLLHEVCTSSSQIGMTLGVAIHDTSQVLGSAMSYRETFQDEVVLETAAVTKLVRNLGLAVAIPALTYQHVRSQSTSDTPEKTENSPETHSGLVSFTKYVPTFLIAFLGMSVARSTGDYLMLEASLDPQGMSQFYSSTMNFIGNDLSKYLLGTAMAGVGLATDTKSLENVGWKPFAVGGAGAMVVGGTGFMVATLTVA